MPLDFKASLVLLQLAIDHVAISTRLQQALLRVADAAGVIASAGTSFTLPEESLQRQLVILQQELPERQETH